MEKYAWKALIKDGCLEEYVRRHDNLPAEMAEVLRQAGIRNYSIWNVGNELFGYYLSEIRGWNRRVENARDSMPKPTYYVGEGKQVSKTAFFHMSEEEEYGSDWYYYKD